MINNKDKTSNTKYSPRAESRNQKGATTILLAFFILTILLLISLTVGSIMVFEIKMTRDIANSIPAFYAADAGAERCLYQARCGLLSPTLTECTDQIGMSKNQGCAVVPGSIAVYGLSNSASVNQALRTAANQITSKGIFSGTNRKVEINW